MQPKAEYTETLIQISNEYYPYSILNRRTVTTRGLRLALAVIRI